MGDDEILSSHGETAFRPPLDQGRPEALGDATALKPSMNGHQIKIRIDRLGVLKHGPAIRPTRQKEMNCVLHDRQEMTNSVISQASMLEIDTKLVIRQSAGMAAQTKSRLSEHLRNEMTPSRIGYRLMLLREALGLLPSEMADRLDIPRTYWSRFEGGKRAITDDVAAMLVERFGVTLDFIVLGRWDRLPMDLGDAMRAVEVRKKM